jgi:NADPH-dependent ferric siderophore reductase
MRPRPLGPREVEQLTLDTEPWLSCDDCFALVDEYVEALLAGDPTGSPAMSAHLRGCPACAEEAVTLVVLAAEETGEDPAPALALLRR